MEELTIDREFANLCPELTPEEFKLLEQSILDDGCREPITIWANNQGTILDGHNRYKICKANGKSFKVRALKLERGEAINWIIGNQLGRRNVTDEQKSYLRGKRYVEENKGHGGDRKSDNGSSAHNAHLKTADKLAGEYDVNPATIRRDAKFAEAVDLLAAPIRKEVLSGESELTRSQVAVIAELPKAEQVKIVAKGPEAVAKKVKQIKEKKPKPDKRLEFDTVALNKELAKEKKNGRVTGFDERKLDDAFRKLSQSLDEQYNKLQTLYMEREASMGGNAQLFDKCKRAAKIALSKSHDNVNDALGALKTWRSGR